ncbi:energy transducer TonB [Phenylobacterium sp.]|uniref:energy transducer TonB family protein n=1 Tax=Phenylobacterium sp. TaxID=1871053 RepID=UPI00343658EE
MAAPAHDQPGQVVLICTVVANAKLDDCTVQSESPAGAGFGEKAIRASKEMRFRGPVGARVKIPMTFRPPESEDSER